MPAVLVTTENLLGEAPFDLGEGESRHLAGARRIASGAAITLLDGCGRRRQGVVESVSRRSVICRSAGGVETLPRPAVALTLFQCVAKQSRMDWLVEKAAELGVERLVPVVSERAVARPALGEKPDRWQRIAESALRQSGSGWLMQVEAPLDWTGALQAMRACTGRLLVGALMDGAPDAGQVLLGWREAGFSGPVGWLIGPEGDFTPTELDAAVHEANAIPVSFGSQVLRVETAALFAVAATFATLGAPR
ncbi:MAG: RsmE family RNA methyltransferase [Kiritimatiellia bacterium]|jgi:16S rRNA (uracil1498-N3)-methyltransferase